MSFLTNLSLFQKTRIKLTLWYLLIIMIISIAFSVGIYRLMTAELNRFEQMQQRRLEVKMQLDPYVRELPENAKDILRERMLDNEIIEEAKLRIKFALLLINIGILAASFAAGYFWAGKTLKPIQEMVDDQNRFITDSSHELKTPLTALRSEMEVSLRDKNLKIKDARDLIKSNLEEVIAIQSLTENLLKLTKSSNAIKKIITAVKIDQVVNDAIKKVSPLAKQKEIEIIRSVEPLIIQANESELVELCVIFLDNAIKYSDKKTVVELAAKKKGSELEIKIKDQGIGIDQKDIPHLFERFYRVDKSRTKNDAEGFGLGLSIAKRIIDGMNGKINVESKLNKGTTFLITLPLRQNSAQLKNLKLFS